MDEGMSKDESKSGALPFLRKGYNERGGEGRL